MGYQPSHTTQPSQSTQPSSPNNILVYVLSYLNIDSRGEGHVIGVFSKKEDAVIQLIKSAGFMQDSRGRLTEFGNINTKYRSMDHLIEHVTTNMGLQDFDIFTIDPMFVK